MKADQRSWMGKAGRVEPLQQFHNASGLAGSKCVTRGFELRKHAVESFSEHGRVPTRVHHALPKSRLCGGGSPTRLGMEQSSPHGCSSIIQRNQQSSI